MLRRNNKPANPRDEVVTNAKPGANALADSLQQKRGNSYYYAHLSMGAYDKSSTGTEGVTWVVQRWYSDGPVLLQYQEFVYCSFSLSISLTPASSDRHGESATQFGVTPVSYMRWWAVPHPYAMHLVVC